MLSVEFLHGDGAGSGEVTHCRQFLNCTDYSRCLQLPRQRRVHVAHVFRHCAPLSELFAAHVAPVRSPAGVRQLVLRQVRRRRERPPAHVAHEWSLSRVRARVHVQFLGGAVSTAADFTRVWPSARVTVLVYPQFRRRREPLGAESAAVRRQQRVRLALVAPPLRAAVEALRTGGALQPSTGVHGGGQWRPTRAGVPGGRAGCVRPVSVSTRSGVVAPCRGTALRGRHGGLATAARGARCGGAVHPAGCIGAVPCPQMSQQSRGRAEPLHTQSAGPLVRARCLLAL